MKTNDYSIRLEKPEDCREVENLVRESFWNVYRPGCSEHFVVHVLRDDPAFVKELDFVMEKDGELIGQNMFMRTVIEARRRPGDPRSDHGADRHYAGAETPGLRQKTAGLLPGEGNSPGLWRGTLRGQYRFLRPLRLYLCPELRHPLSRFAGGCR